MVVEGVTENLLSEFYDCHEQGEVKSGVNDLDLEGCGPSIVAMEREEDLEEKSTAKMRLFLSPFGHIKFL